MPSTTISLEGCSLTLAPAAAASASRSVELIHGSGGRSVLDATNFWVLLSISVKGLLSVRLGQTEKKSSYVRRPNRRPPVVAMLSPAALPISGSAYGSAQPPCPKPPRLSSSHTPGA